MNFSLTAVHRYAKNITLRATSFMLALGLALGSVLAALPLDMAKAQNLTPAPRVSFTFDDGLKSALTEAAPVLAAHGFSGTNYVTTGCIGMTTAPNTCGAGGDLEYMTWDQVAELHSIYGWEIGSHTVSHPLLDSTDPDFQPVKLTNAQVTAELRDSKAALNARGYEALSFAAPFGDYNNFTRSEAAKYYTSFRGFHDIDYNNFPYNDQLIVVQQVQDGVTVDQVKQYIANAKANKQWLVLVFHDIKQTSSGNPADYQFSTANLNAVAQYVKEQGVQVTNMSNGLVDGKNNLLPSGGFNSETLGIYTGAPSTTSWVTSDTANIKIDTANNGSYPGPTKSVSIKSGAANNYLFSPLVAVNSGENYVIKSFLNVTAFTGGELGYYIHEYDANGVEIGGQWKRAVTKVFVENINLTYTPSSEAVKSASLEVYTTANSGIMAYVDNFAWFSTNDTPVPPVDTIAPIISNVSSLTMGSGSVMVTFNTNELTTNRIDYGLTTAYGLSQENTLTTTTPWLTLSGLTPHTKYFYKVTSTDLAGNSSVFTGEFTVNPIGDLNNDSKVDDSDLSVLLYNWYTTGKTGLTYEQGDLAGKDGIVDDSDLSVLLYNWTKEN